MAQDCSQCRIGVTAVCAACGRRNEAVRITRITPSSFGFTLHAADGQTPSNRPSLQTASLEPQHPPDTHFPARRGKIVEPIASIPVEHSPGPGTAPDHVPGYVVESILGFGGMGTVYLARQLSLDRAVALKVMSRNWSQDAVFSARFTREAFAAAMLNHPNVVQIYDVGDVDGYRYFSMEYVPGRSLSEVVRRQGKLDPETAVGYILQAARGLKHAHERGLIHRDVKPDNLLLNEQGIVKVADLGLVKTPDVCEPLDRAEPGIDATPMPRDMTGTRMALGTPAYMAPEQCRDAASVDHRADIYSLGCTLYVLVTGRAPFDGRTAVELMTKHAYEPMVPPEQLVARIPKELSAVIQKMMAKRIGDRFPNMAEVIRTLEQWLGIHHTGTFSPRDEQIDHLEACVQQFNHAPTVILRDRVLSAAATVVMLAAVLFMFFGKLSWAFGLAGLVLQAATAYFLVHGLTNKTYFFRRVRQFTFGLSAWDGILVCGGLGLFALLLWMLGIFWIWVGFGLIGTAVAGAMRLAFDRAIAAERRESLDQCATLLRRMRRHGLDEEELRQFTAKHGGMHWEEFFEALFGYEAKLGARALLLRGVGAGTRERYAGWREPILHLIDRVEKTRREQRERKLLEGIERARLLAAGMDAGSADAAAERTADEFLTDVEALREGRPLRGGPSSGYYRTDSLPEVSEFLALHGRQQRFGLSAAPGEHDWLGRAVGWLVGPHVRIVLAVLLMSACVLWVHQNRSCFGLGEATVPMTGTTGLLLEGVPSEATDWADSANVGWAGVLMLASLFFRGNRMALFVLLGAGICVFGTHFGIRTVEPIRDHHAAIILGSVFTLIGFRLGRT